MKFWALVMVVAMIGCGSKQKSEKELLEEFQKKAAAAVERGDEAGLQKLEEDYEKEKAAIRK